MKTGWQEKSEVLYFLQFSLLSPYFDDFPSKANSHPKGNLQTGYFRTALWHDEDWGLEVAKPGKCNFHFRGTRLGVSQQKCPCSQRGSTYLATLSSAICCCCVTLGQWLHLSEAQFLHLCDMDINGTYLTELSELKTGNLMEQYQSHSKLSVNMRPKHTKPVFKE